MIHVFVYTASSELLIINLNINITSDGKMLNIKHLSAIYLSCYLIMFY